MTRRVLAVMAIGFWLSCSSVPKAEAHLKDYLVNQDYYTAKRGEFEVALWNDMNFTEADQSGSYNSKHQMELEYGITNHVQLAYYEVYKWNRDNDWERDAFKIEAKARLAEAGQWPLDVAFYTEYENPNGRRVSDSDALENKVILSRDFGPWNLVGNFIFTKKLNTGRHWAYEYTAGVSYAVTPRTRLGLEVKQGLGESGDFVFNRTQPLYLVPGLYMNVTPHVRLLVGPSFGLTKASDDVQLKSIVEVEF